MRFFSVLLLSCAIFMIAAAESENEELPPALLKCIDDMAAIIIKSAPAMKECDKAREQESESEGLGKYEKCVDDVKSKYPEIYEIKARCETAREEASSLELTRAQVLLSSRTQGELPPALLKCVDDIIAIANKITPEKKECAKIPTESDERMNKYDACVIGVKAKYPELDEVEKRCVAAANAATRAETIRAAQILSLRIRTAGLSLP